MMSETVIVVHFIFKMSDFALLNKPTLCGCGLTFVALDGFMCVAFVESRRINRTSNL